LKLSSSPINDIISSAAQTILNPLFLSLSKSKPSGLFFMFIFCLLSLNVSSERVEIVSPVHKQVLSVWTQQVVEEYLLNELMKVLIVAFCIKYAFSYMEFLGNFKFTAKLRRKCGDFPIYHLPPPTLIPPPVINNSQWSDVLVKN
jgi:hypothetical protein